MTKKKKFRHGHRVYAQKLIAKAEEIIKNYDPSQENKLKQLKISLEDRLETLRALDAEILDELEDEKGIEEEIQEAGVFSERVLEIVVEIESVLSRKDKEENGSDSASPNPTATSATSGNKHTQLPRLMLKNFLGDLVQWLTFWDSFRSAVHENPELHNMDKFNYLKSLLSRPAAATIAGLSLTSDNSTAAIELLTKRFGNKQVIISHGQPSKAGASRKHAWRSEATRNLRQDRSARKRPTSVSCAYRNLPKSFGARAYDQNSRRYPLFNGP